MKELLNKEVVVICRKSAFLVKEALYNSQRLKRNTLKLHIYSGILTKVDKQRLTLTEPQIVYDTGSWHEREFTKAEKLPAKKLSISINLIEALQERE